MYNAPFFGSTSSKVSIDRMTVFFVVFCFDIRAHFSRGIETQQNHNEHIRKQIHNHQQTQQNKQRYRNNQSYGKIAFLVKRAKFITRLSVIA